MRAAFDRSARQFEGLRMRIPRSVRRFADPVTESIPLPIIAGVNRGRFWNLASAGSGYVSGRRAVRQMQLLQALISPGDVVWDVGAHHGYVTLVATERVGLIGWVHAFEPSPRNLRILERHVRWNQLRNVSVHPVALASYTGTARFGGGNTSKVHSLGQGAEEVSVCAAETLVRSGAVRPPTFMKIDVEGSEAEVLAGALSALPPHVRILVAMHSAATDRECTRLLQAHGFELIASRALEKTRAHQWRADPDLLCIGPAFDKRSQLKQVLKEHR